MSNELRFECDDFAFTVHAQGAALHALEMAENQWLFPFSSVEERLQWAAGAVLFPFPGRLQHNAMQSGGRTHQWPINNAETASALHGLSTSWHFDLQPTEQGVRACYNYNGEEAYFPYPCRVEVAYRWTSEAFILDFTVSNTGESDLPFHWGWHPYWNLHEPWSFEGNAVRQMNTNALKQLQEPGEFLGYHWEKEVDQAFEMTGDLTLSNGSAQLRQHYRNRPWVQLFRPAGKPWLAIEPMSGLGHEATPWIVVPSKEAHTERVILTFVL